MRSGLQRAPISGAARWVTLRQLKQVQSGVPHLRRDSGRQRLIGPARSRSGLVSTRRRNHMQFRPDIKTRLFRRLCRGAVARRGAGRTGLAWPSEQWGGERPCWAALTGAILLVVAAGRPGDQCLHQRPGGAAASDAVPGAQPRPRCCVSGRAARSPTPTGQRCARARSRGRARRSGVLLPSISASAWRDCARTRPRARAGSTRALPATHSSATSTGWPILTASMPTSATSVSASAPRSGWCTRPTTTRSPGCRTGACSRSISNIACTPSVAAACAPPTCCSGSTRFRVIIESFGPSAGDVLLAGARRPAARAAAEGG